MYGLNDQIIQQLRYISHSYKEVEDAILYGSRVRNNYKPYSDIDITLKGNLSLTQMSKIESQIDDLLLPYFCDLSNYNQLTNKDLIERIDAEGKSLM